MKQAFFAMALCISMSIHAQNVGIGNSSPHPNAKLDITATDKGVLIPRMDSTHRKAIPNTIGLLLYDSTTNSFWYNNGTAWQNMATAASGWSLTGNSGTDPNVNFLGTTDNTSLLFKVGNQLAGKIESTPVGVTAFGRSALANNLNQGTGPGMENSAFGNSALAANTTGQVNTAMGFLSLANNTKGSANTAIGAETLLSDSTGSGNTGVGHRALVYNSGSQNTAVGDQCMPGGTGNYNTAVGAMANVAGDFSTALGYNTVALFSNSAAIGANAKADASNKIRLGDENVTIVESNGVFNTVSDGRFKYNIQENVKGLDFIMKLRPVTYQFNTKKQEDFTKGNLTAEQLNSSAIPAAFNENNNIKRTGFIAQEVAVAAQKTGYDFDGVKIPATDKQYYSLSYASFVVPLVKAMQEQQQTIETLKKQNDLLQQQNEMILRRLEALEKK